jgi:hypothetical protein
MMGAECAECNEFDQVFPGTDGSMYCESCWGWYSLRETRCFSLAALYDAETGRLLSTGASDIGVGCAERVALWRLKDEEVERRKILVVARIRRNRKNKTMSFGTSKPCKQCICAMSFYNVDRVCYSAASGFVWDSAAAMQNEYTSCSPVIVKL